MLQFTLHGRLTADPEFTTYDDDRPMARLRVASTQPGTDGTDFFDVAVFDLRARVQLDAARTGDWVRLDGTARQRTWHTDDGTKREQIGLAARRIEIHPGRRSRDERGAGHTISAQASR